MNLVFKGVFAGALAVVAVATAAQAQESYSSQLAGQFTDWCTAKQGQPQTVCSCALSKAAQQIPAAAMASYLAAPAGAAMATTSSGIGATALQIVTTCATGSSAAGVGAAMGAASGLLGK